MNIRLKKEDFARLSGGYHDNPQRSLSLKAETYTDPLWYELDQQAVIAQSWQWVCHVEKLREPGSYKTATIAGKPIAIVRDKEGVLRAF